MKSIYLIILVMAGFLPIHAQTSGSPVMSIFANGKNPDFNLNPLYRTPAQTYTVRCKTIFLRNGETLVARLRKARVFNLDSAKVVSTISIRQDNEWVEFPAKLEKGEYFWVDVVSGPINRVQGGLNVRGRAGENATDINWYLAQQIPQGNRNFSITLIGDFTETMDIRDAVRLRLRTSKIFNLDSAVVVGEILLNKDQPKMSFPSKLQENRFYWIDVVNSSIDFSLNVGLVSFSATDDLILHVSNIKTHKHQPETSLAPSPTPAPSPVSPPPTSPTPVPVSPAPPPATPQPAPVSAQVHTSPLPTVQTVIPEGAVRDLDGNIYRTITLGNLIWFQDNLRTSQYNDTTPIPRIISDADWSNARLGGYAIFENKDENEALFGKLYNGYAVATGKLCPLGWRVPTDDDWKALERYIGIPNEEIDRTGGRGSQAGKLKSTTLWAESSYANTNETGFSALPGGGRFTNGDFKVKEQYADFWSSTIYENPYSLYLWNRHFFYNSHETGRMYMSANNGFSCRCVKNK